MADGLGSLIKWGAIGAAAWIGYEYFFATPATAAVAATAGGGGGTSTTTPPATTPPAPTSTYNTPSALLGRITSAASSAGVATSATLSPDVWDTYYNSQGGQAIGGPPPDPVSIFGSHDPITLAQYWAGISQWLASTKGLTGLGVYAGLGRLAGVWR